ncbi:MAG TPA: hypothetical protein PKV12_00145 [Candidatus Syntrophosphaera sp.]|nr:hypothetical protein [Candidatus Syntrophosphaera sp.]
MDIGKLSAIFCWLVEQFAILCEWNIGEIHPMLLHKALVVLIVMYNRIDIIK